MLYIIVLMTLFGRSWALRALIPVSNLGFVGRKINSSSSLMFPRITTFTSLSSSKSTSEAPGAQNDSSTMSSPPPKANKKREAHSSTSREKLTRIGRWEEMHGNYVLAPPSMQQPRALIHFLGGAFVGAAPHVAYRYILERLSDRGYLIVATPFNLSFDYLTTCDSIIDKFERIAPMLARQYGAVPVVGVGQSCGALLQLLITSLFPDTPRAANVLLSFNNKEVSEAVPFFEEVFAPLFVGISEGVGGTAKLESLLDLARAAALGELPSDELLSEISNDFASGLPLPFTQEQMSIPSALRENIASAIQPTSTALNEAGILSILNQGLDVIDQIPLLVNEVADGARDFVPPPDMVKTAARRAYRARRTLLIQYKNDGIDESEEVEELLKEAESIMRMKRPMVTMGIERKVLEGNHATPLLAPPLDLASRLEDVLGETAPERLLYAQADDTVNEIAKWLEEAQL